jgi:DNA-binding transcriptional regulator GbsR (MarR family)
MMTLFAAVASSLGYSDIHGRIIASLLIAKKMLSLLDLAKKTGYSLASVSLSLDMLELAGIIRKIKTPSDRKLYAKLEGDVLESLRNVLIFKLQKEIASTLHEFETRGSDESCDSVDILVKELKRLEKYVGDLAKVKLPK